MLFNSVTVLEFIMRHHQTRSKELKRMTEDIRERGFTLLEVMISIAILSIGLLAIASMQVRAVEGNASADRLTEGTNWGQDKIEELMALPYTQALTDPNLTDDGIVAVNIEPYTDSFFPLNGIYDVGEAFTDWNGNGVRDNVAGAAREEVYVDANANGLWDVGEAFTDANGNGVWDAAHVDPNPPEGFTITWSVIDNNPVNLAKFIRVFVTRQGETRPTLLTSIKARQ
jgi:prepilin-type N-terminal cleavage/methylation domain-containing protein